jgi:hypothetical protein
MAPGLPGTVTNVTRSLASVRFSRLPPRGGACADSQVPDEAEQIGALQSERLRRATVLHLMEVASMSRRLNSDTAP